ncbi:MAG TPA: CAP domain-containing protein [Candidatus Saccharimonadales bacterium]|jgi:uncharacterized protein YkwD
MALTAQRKPSVHHKKTRGAHHRHSKHYLKTYSPYLPILLLVIIGLAINSFWSSRTQVLGTSTSLTANELLQTTNIERSRQQQPDLAVNQKLSQAAQAKANDMVQRDYWSHNAPDGTTPWSFVEKTGYEYQAAGENLAYGFMNAPTIVTGWMNSPEHRANILNRSYQEIGIGITNSPNYQGKGPATVVVAMYGQPAGSTVGVNATVSGTTIPGADSSAATTNQPFRNVSRIDVLTGGVAPWSFAVLSALTLACLAVLVFRHAYAWHRMLIKSEDFVLAHKKLDVIAVSLLMIGFLLTRTGGFIG